MRAVRIALPSVRIKRSDSAFAFGHNGAIFLCTRPSSLVKALKEWLLNGGSLSVFGCSGIPCVANMFSYLGMTAVTKVEETGSTSG